MPRTDLSKATLQIMKTIQNGEIYTLNKISEKTELNFRTVQKALFFDRSMSKTIGIKKDQHNTHESCNTYSDESKKWDNINAFEYPKNVNAYIILSNT